MWKLWKLIIPTKVQSLMWLTSQWMLSYKVRELEKRDLVWCRASWLKILSSRNVCSNRCRPHEFKPLFVQMVYLLWSELNEHFDDKNTALWESMESLLPSSKTFLNPVSLEKLFECVDSSRDRKKTQGKIVQNLVLRMSWFQGTLRGSWMGN